MKNLLLIAMGLFCLSNIDCAIAGAGVSTAANCGQRGSEAGPSCSSEELGRFCRRLRMMGRVPGVTSNFSDVTPENIGNRWRELSENESFAVDAVTAGFYGIAEFLIQQRAGDMKEKSLHLMLSACIDNLRNMVNNAMKGQKNNKKQDSELDPELQNYENNLVYFLDQDGESFVQMFNLIVLLVEKKGVGIMNDEYSNGKTVKVALAELVERIYSPDFSGVLQLLDDSGSPEAMREAMSFAITSRRIDDIAMESGRSFKF